MTPTEALKACALFKGFTETGLGIMAGIAQRRNYPKGVPLFAEKMVGDSLFILSAGTVRISSKNAAGEDVTLAEIGPGDYLGELSLIRQAQRQCTATAASDVSALELRNADFQKLMAQKPQACIKLLMAVCAGFAQKVVDTQDQLKRLLEPA